MSKKNILLVSPYSLNNYGGVQNQINLIKQLLCNQSYRVKIFAHGSDDYNNKAPIAIKFNGSKSNVSITCNKLLLEEAIEWSDIVHIHEPFIPLILWKMKTDKPIITTHHAYLNVYWCKLLKIIYGFKTKQLSIVSVCVSVLSSKQAAALRPNPIVIPNFIVLNPDTSFNGKSKRIMFLGRDEKRKGLKIYLNSIDSFIVNKLMPTVISNRSINNIFVDSYVNISEVKKFELLEQTLILVAPNTKQESFGVILLEAIANGAIVIASGIPAFKNVLSNSGVYFKNRSSKNLNTVIKDTLDADIETIWEKQYKRLLQYQSDNVLPQIIDLYNK